MFSRLLRPLFKPLHLAIFLAVLLVSACTAVPTTTTSTAPTNETASETSATTETTTETVGTEEATSSIFPLTITDAAGVEYTFDSPPKIGCWWAGCMEILADLGVSPHASAYTDENKDSAFFYPAGVPAQQIADTSSPEAWAAAEVDVIIMRVPPDPSQDLVKEAAPVFYLHHPSYGESSQTGYAAFVENLRIMAQLLDNPEAAEIAIARFETVMDNLSAIATEETAARSVSVLFNGEGYSMIGTENPFCDALVQTGLGHCTGDAKDNYEVNAEEFLSLDPDWIVYQIGPSYTERTDPVWSQLTAVKEGQVYDAQGHRYYCCSLRGLIHGLQEFAHHTVPEANIPAPGFWLDFDPLQSPLTQPQ